jgi:hypothetical protein
MQMETINTDALVLAMSNWNTWVILLVVALAGILGGLAHKLTSPIEDKMSLVGYVVVGAVASLAVLFVFVPKDAVRLIALSLASGYGGKSILNALEEKVKTAIAKADAADAKEKGKEVADAAQKAISIAQSYSQIHNIVSATEGQENFLKSFKAKLPVNLHSFTEKPTELHIDELKQLSNKVEFLRESFSK